MWVMVNPVLLVLVTLIAEEVIQSMNRGIGVDPSSGHSSLRVFLDDTLL